jgi:hypothetical protein
VVYEVSDPTVRKKKPAVDLPPALAPEPPCGPSEAYRATRPWDGAFGDAVEALEGHLCARAAPAKYVPPEARRTASTAHSLLCDLGFLTADANETRRIPPALLDALDALDAAPFHQVVVVFVLQMIADERQIASRDTPALHALLADLDVADCSICRFSFVAPVLRMGQYRSLTSLAAQAGIAVILNESGLSVNRRCAELENLDVVIVVSVESGDRYGVELLFGELAVFGHHQIGPLTLSIGRRSLARFVAIAVYLFFAAPGRTLANGHMQVKGPDHFISGFYTRAMLIGQIFERAEKGRNAILLGCLSCGKPEPE